MKFSSYITGDITRGLLPWQKPLGGKNSADYALSRYSFTNTCISSSRSILQIMLRAEP